MSLKFKRNYKIVLTLLIVVLVLVFGFGQQRLIAYTTQAQTETVSAADGTTYTNSVDLFDDTVVHSIQVLISQDDYDTMVKTYQETNLKEYYKADVIIDGVRINDVGFRLKGNASLGMALGGQVDTGNGQCGWRHAATRRIPDAGRWSDANPAGWNAAPGWVPDARRWTNATASRRNARRDAGRYGYVPKQQRRSENPVYDQIR